MRNSEDDFKLLTLEELPQAIMDAFGEIYEIETQICDLKKQHIKPLESLRNTAWRKIKSESDISRKYLAKWYGLIKDEWLAQDCEDSEDGERIQHELNRAYEALHAGQMVNFMSVLEKFHEARENGTEAKPEENRAPARKETEKKPLTVAAPTVPSAPKAPVIEKDNDWDKAPDAADSKTKDDAKQAGYAHQDGEKSGLAGEDLAEALKRTGWHHASARYKSFKAGHEQGSKLRAQQLQEEASPVEAENADDKASEDDDNVVLVVAEVDLSAEEESTNRSEEESDVPSNVVQLSSLAAG